MMKTITCLLRSKKMPVMATAMLWILTPVAEGQLLISGNENKIALTSGSPAAVEDPQPDSISLIDFSQFPPQVRHTVGLSNTVIGPPSNLAILPGGHRAVLADSLTMDRSAEPNPWRPARQLHLLDLSAQPIQIVATAEVGLQPSGLSVTADGQRILVANRASGTVSVVSRRGDQLMVVDEVSVADPDDSVSDVAIHPNGHMALVSVQQAGYLAALTVDAETVKATDQKFSVYGQPYRVVITPDGELALTAGTGTADNGVDYDAVSIIDLVSQPPRTIDYVAVGAVPESIEISPDGTWLAVVLMAGSNLPSSDPHHSPHGQLVLLKRDGKAFNLTQRISIGRIPEGVAFTSDGKYLLAQCHADRNIHVYKMSSRGADDTGHRIEVPGFPSSLRSVD